MTPEIALTLAVLLATVLLFVFEALRVDVIAVLVMLSLAWLKLVTPAQAFSGLAGTAVVSMIAVMIMGAGVDRSGIMNRMIRPVVKMAGPSERKLTAIVSSAAGLISAFMQNIGAAALFLPAVMRISNRARLPISRLLMPLGFAAILGGTLTMVGSGPLIILNDLLKQKDLEPFGLFSVTPLGLALLASGVLYFVVLGRRVLPDRGEVRASPQQEIIDAWQLPCAQFYCRVPAGSALDGKNREEARLWARYGLHLLALEDRQEVVYAPWRQFRFEAGQLLTLMGREQAFQDFVKDFGLIRLEGGADGTGSQGVRGARGDSRPKPQRGTSRNREKNLFYVPLFKPPGAASVFHPSDVCPAVPGVGALQFQPRARIVKSGPRVRRRNTWVLSSSCSSS